MDEYHIRFVCVSCRGIFDGITLIPPDDNKQDWYSGFLCGKCHQKRQSAKVFKDVGF